MLICPKCNAQNRPEAAFCANCGTILLAQPAQPKPADKPAPPLPAEELLPAKPIAPPAIPAQELPPTVPPAFTIRSEGSTFGDHFLYNALVSQGEHDIFYTVTELSQPNAPSIRMCSNPACRSIHSPTGPDVENFCTQCGQPLDQRSPVFLLQESDADKFGAVKPVIALRMVHPNVHPPLATFKQDLPGGARYCLVTPYSQDLPAQPKMAEVLDWGLQLAEGLDYLQAKGIALGEEFHPSIIGLAEHKVVWRDFSSMRVTPMLTDRERINNARILALAMHSWMTGSTTYSLDPYLSPELNNLFQKALVGEGFSSGSALAQQINLAKSAGASRLTLDYHVGHRTHSGNVRTQNEDSLLSLELSSIYQSNIQPFGIFGIADGMGGHASGEVASKLVIQTIAQRAASALLSLENPNHDELSDWLKQCFQAANQAVYIARQSADNDMGSTLVLALIVGSQAFLAHLGDSRIYLVNHEAIRQLTTDHSLVQNLVASGKISQDEARNHPQRNVIYRSLGEKPLVEPDYLTHQLFPNDRLLLCSDGLTSKLDDQQIQKIVLEATSPQAACNQLVDAANLAGGEDNISVIVVEVVPVAISEG